MPLGPASPSQGDQAMGAGTGVGVVAPGAPGVVVVARGRSRRRGSG